MAWILLSATSLKTKKSRRGTGFVLINQISQLLKIDTEQFRRIQEEFCRLEPSNWTRVYSEYQSGGWKTLSLLNQSGLPGDTVIRDCAAIETPLLSLLPSTREFLRGLGLKYMWVRLAKLESNGFMWEHRDYAELANLERLRLHLPILTNEDAALILGGNRVHMAEGYLWKLDPTERHAACNLGRESRVHLIIDCYGDSILENLMNSESLDMNLVRPLPEASDELIKCYTEKSLSLARLGFLSSAESIILKMYHEYHLAEGFSYDLVAKMYSELGKDAISRDWQQKKQRFLGAMT